MNINVWIIKICKALKTIFRCIFTLMVLWAVVLHLLFFPLFYCWGEKSLLPAGPIYKHVLKDFSKCSFRLGESTSFFPIVFASFSITYSVSAPLFNIIGGGGNLFSHTRGQNMAPTFIFILCLWGVFQKGDRGVAVVWNILEVHFLTDAGKWCQNRWSSWGGPCSNWRDSLVAPSHIQEPLNTPGNPSQIPVLGQLRKRKQKLRRREKKPTT